MTLPRLLFVLVPLALAACSADEGAGPPPPTAQPPASDAGAPAPDAARADATTTPPADAATGVDGNGQDAATAAPRHARCGWIGADDTNGYATFAAHADFFDVVHPDWYALADDGVALRTLTGAEDATVLTAAAAHHVQVIPMIAGADPGVETILRAMMSDASKRAAHIENLVALAKSKGWSGLDLDYEHLWEASDRPLFTQFIREASAAMHAAGKTLSIAVPALADAGGANAWDYAALAELLDTLHVMGYDYHSIGTHAGPTAPLGWIEAVAAHAEATGHADKFVLGLPNYGTTPTWYGTLGDCLAACNGTYATQTTHMDGNNCSYNVDTHYVAGRSLNCTSANGALFFDDTLSLEEKVKSAKAHGMRGITYWTIGGEPAGFFDMIRRYY